MRTIKTLNGAPITLDGDLLAIMEALYREVTARQALDRARTVVCEPVLRISLEVPTESTPALQRLLGR